ncbi:MAG: Ni/Fe-hydrogenase 1 b-type cytochrome subunit [Ponticaulis sp.]|nr:Ni/Fe-hydrogenase 1 b-type cytochrome subunit [Ponticaulis sp.]
MSDVGLSENPSRITVWDWTLRSFHWLLVTLIICQWSTADNHGIWKQLDQLVVSAGWSQYGLGNMGWHRYFGYAVLFLLIYRIYWGIFGASTAKFSNFVKGPAAIMGYVKHLKEKPYKPGLGHNPIGALSVVALILVLVAQVTTGLFAVDVDGIESGPLSHMVDFDTGRMIAGLHENAFRALYILIGLHVAAILVYKFVLKANLVPPMITGKRPVAETRETDIAPVNASPLIVILGVAVSAGLTWLILGL